MPGGRRGTSKTSLTGTVGAAREGAEVFLMDLAEALCCSAHPQTNGKTAHAQAHAQASPGATFMPQETQQKFHRVASVRVLDSCANGKGALVSEGALRFDDDKPNSVRLIAQPG